MRLGDLLDLVNRAAARASSRAASSDASTVMAHATAQAARACAPLIHMPGPSGRPLASLPGDIASIRVCDITEDSRTVVPGSLFIARKGLKSDGNAFAAAAIDAGAVAILTDDAALASQDLAVPVLACDDALLASALIGEAFYGDASRSLDLVGVTGTNGKTTITYLIWQLLNACKKRCGLIGTVQIDDGVETARAMMTTPPAIEVSRTLARMLEAGCAAAAMEVSSHALHQKRADALRIRAAVFTNLTGDHLDYHGTMDNYAAAKARLFELIDPSGVALVNALDPWHARMVRDCKAPVRRLAVLDATHHHDRGYDYTATILSQSMQGMKVRLTGPANTFDPFEASTHLIGTFNAFNLLAAFAAARELGLPLAAVKTGIESLQPPPGRLERVSALASPVHAFVDYAHSDDSLASVLDAVAQVMPDRAHGETVDAVAGAPRPAPASPRLWCVFGCGGDRDKTKRPRMGLAAAQAADQVIITSDNPRTERPSDIVDQVLAGIPAGLRHKVQVQVDRARAVHAAVQQAQPGDVIIVAGKGHETEQILPDGKGGMITNHFDDREVTREALTASGYPVLPLATTPKSSAAKASRTTRPRPEGSHVPSDGPRGS
jgi:UDP-N-acetylmuramoyl-L-alanyl-D-glutamate--2,6-diaminopimelate ligase